MRACVCCGREEPSDEILPPCLRSSIASDLGGCPKARLSWKEDRSSGQPTRPRQSAGAGARAGAGAGARQRRGRSGVAKSNSSLAIGAHESGKGDKRR